MPRRRPYPRTPQNKSAAMKAMEKLATEVDILSVIHHLQKGNLEKFSRTIGHRRMVHDRLKKGGDVKISLILLLSKELRMNFLNNYLRLLPEEIRATNETYVLDREIAELKSQLEESGKQTAYWKERAERAEGWIAGKMDK